MPDEPKFTPGPWLSMLTPKGDVFITAENGLPLARIFQPWDNKGTQALNTFLVAQAPAMYAALEGLLVGNFHAVDEILTYCRHCDRRSNEDETWEQHAEKYPDCPGVIARAVLAAARGEA